MKTSGKPHARPHAILLAALMGATLALSACATVKGAGKDIQSAGQAVEDEINE
ncbi:MAG TPA: entericidin A/B family lipoprotein [Sphingobium sp.]|nr:entericidin A/B family lipoprotein [Sphingobium sp.]